MLWALCNLLTTSATLAMRIDEVGAYTEVWPCLTQHMVAVLQPIAGASRDLQGIADRDFERDAARRASVSQLELIKTVLCA